MKILAGLLLMAGSFDSGCALMEQLCVFWVRILMRLSYGLSACRLIFFWSILRVIHLATAFMSTSAAQRVTTDATFLSVCLAPMPG